MDRERFDALARLLAATGSRRGAIGALIGAGLLGTGLEAEARKRNGNRRGGGGKGKDRDKDKDKDRGKGNGKTKDRKKRAQAEQIPARCCSTGNCTPGKGKNLFKCCYEDGNVANKNFSGANLGQANFTNANASGANFQAANLGQACLVDANLTGAKINASTNLGGAIFCRTIMPDTSVNNSGCFSGTRCCPTCEQDAQCGAGAVCCNGNCKIGDCCTNADCDDPNEPVCISNTCSPCTTDGQCGGDLTCCEPICTDTDTDEDNCGFCGHECSAGEDCTDGDCCLPFTTFGNTASASGGVRLISDLTNASPFGGVRFTLPSATVDFDDISVLQSAYNSENAPGCRLGSPRFQLRTTEAPPNTVWVYFSPNNNCPTGPQDTGNLIGNETPGVYDTSQITGGTQVSTYSATKALLQAQGLLIDRITLVVDGGSAGNPQSVVVEPCVSLTPLPPV